MNWSFRSLWRPSAWFTSQRLFPSYFSEGQATMQTGKSYKLFEFLDWTRRDIYVLIVLGVVPAVAYQAGNMKWLGIPWTVVALLGTATAFIVGFKNVQSYNRTWEARHIWGDIISSSRAWGAISRDYLDDATNQRSLSIATSPG